MKKLIMVFSIVFITLGFSTVFITLGMMDYEKSDETFTFNVIGFVDGETPAERIAKGMISGKWINEDGEVIEFFGDNTCTVEAIFPKSYDLSKYIILEDGKIKII